MAKAPPAPWMPGRLIATLPDFQLFDGLKVEVDGRVCVGTLVNGGGTVFSLDGIPVPDIAITNLAFGGEDMRDIWLTASSTGKLYKVRWPQAGLGLNNNR